MSGSENTSQLTDFVATVLVLKRMSDSLLFDHNLVCIEFAIIACVLLCVLYSLINFMDSKS